MLGSSDIESLVEGGDKEWPRDRADALHTEYARLLATHGLGAHAYGCGLERRTLNTVNNVFAAREHFGGMYPIAGLGLLSMCYKEFDMLTDARAQARLRVFLERGDDHQRKMLRVLTRERRAGNIGSAVFALEKTRCRRDGSLQYRPQFAAADFLASEISRSWPLYRPGADLSQVRHASRVLQEALTPKVHWFTADELARYCDQTRAQTRLEMHMRLSEQRRRPSEAHLPFRDSQSGRPHGAEVMTLASESTAALRRELARRERDAAKITARRAKLAKQLAALDAELADLGVAGAPRRGRPLGSKSKPRGRKPGRKAGPRTGRKPGRPAGRKLPKNTRSLGDALAATVRPGTIVSPAEAAKRVRTQGYKTTAKNFGKVVTLRLRVHKLFKRRGRGQYERVPG
jgi:hypothetical protein